MQFTSLAFIGGLAGLFLLYYLLPKKAQWPLLLLCSFGFYACAGWQGLCYVVCTVLSTWLIARKIDEMQRRQKSYVAQHRAQLSREERKAYNAKQKHRQRIWLIFCMALNFGVLAATKVLSTDLVQRAMGISFLVPLGISFYTFRIMGYLIDVYRGQTQAQKNPAKLALFTIFFPQVLMGPISRYDNISESLFAAHAFDWDVFQAGAQRIILGFFKKLVIADRLMQTLPALKEMSGISALFAMTVYAAALFCDFTGGMDIAIGIGECLGVKMEENFLSPYRSKNIFEYWRRWHITMGTWFRDYVFYPVSVAKPLQKLTARLKSRGAKRRIPVYTATMLTWFATGIWHGVAWNFVAWGLANGVIILISQELQPLYTRFHKKLPRMQGKLYDAFQIVRTFLLMALIRAFDIYRDVPLTFRRIGSIVLQPQFSALAQALRVLPLYDWLAAGAGICLLLIGTRRLRRLHAVVWLIMILAILVFGLYGLEYDVAEFTYTQF